MAKYQDRTYGIEGLLIGVFQQAKVDDTKKIKSRILNEFIELGYEKGIIKDAMQNIMSDLETDLNKEIFLQAKEYPNIHVGDAERVRTKLVIKYKNIIKLVLEVR